MSRMESMSLNKNKNTQEMNVRIEGEFIPPHELLRQHMTVSAIESIKKVTKKQHKKKKTTTKLNIEDFKCGQCKKKFSNKELLKRHIKIHSTEYPFHCVECNQSFKLKAYLRRHNARVHENRRNHKCVDCGKAFFTSYALKQHLLIHSGEKPFECDVCGKCFNRDSSLVTHQYIHKDMRPYTCSFCTYACRDASTLRKHEAIHKGETKKYTCKLCEKIFRNKFVLKQHVAEYHLLIETRKKYQCYACNNIYKSRQAIVTHIQNIHEKLRQLTCEICDKTFSTKSNRDHHVLTHQDNKPFECIDKYCLKTFKTKQDMMKHWLIHSPIDQYKCDLCGRSFSRKYRLRYHIERHIQKNKSCPHCHLLFFNKKEVLNHVRIKHENHGLHFECDLCGLKAQNKSGLALHILHRHMAKKTHKHRACGDNVINVLKTHSLKRHGIKYRRETNKSKQFEDLLDIKEEPIDIEGNNMKEVLRKLVEIGGDSDRGLDMPSLEETPLDQQISDQDQICRVPDTIMDAICTESCNIRTSLNITEKLLDIDVNILKRDPELLLNSEEHNIIVSNIDRLSKVPENIFDRFCVEQYRKRRESVAVDETPNTSKNHQTDKQNSRLSTISNEIEQKRFAKTDRYVSTDRPRRSVKVVNYNRFYEGLDFGDSTYSKKLCDTKPKLIKNSKRSEDNSVEIKNISKAVNKKPMKTCLKTVEERNDTYESININNMPKTQYKKQNAGKRNKSRVKSSKSCVKTDETRVEMDGTCVEIDEMRVETDETHVDVDEMCVETDEMQNSGLDRIVIQNVKEKYGKFYHIKLNTVQCYVCFKLFETRNQLIEHCREHFNLNNKRQISKCPLCDYETDQTSYSRRSIYQHMKHKHKFHLHSRSTNLNVKRTADDTKFVVKLTNRPRNKITLSEREKNINKYEIKEIEIVPTVENINRQLSREIDKRRREEKRKVIFKNKLVKKGNGWIIESVPVAVADDEVKRILNCSENAANSNEKSDLTVDKYLDSIAKLSNEAKNEGRTMLYPCDRCSKVCQALCALKLHRRIHNTKAKPFKKKIWKHKLGKNPEHISLEAKEKRIVDDEIPKPIKGRHRCDENLKSFYYDCIRGSNIEFDHFLKIYNKLNRDNIVDFDTVEPNRVQDTKETDEPICFSEKGTDRFRNLKGSYVRVIMISKELHLKRLAKIKEMRGEIKGNRFVGEKD